MRRTILAFICLFIATVALAQPSYGPTTNSDQLWQIAIAVRPSAAVSIQQTMVALYKANPDAFVNGDINKLKPGSVLHVPALSVMQQVTQEECSQLTQMQSATVKPIAESDDVRLTARDLSKLHMTKNVEHKLLTFQSQQQDATHALQTQYDNVGKTLIEFDQQYQVRLADLERHNLQLQMQLTQLTQQVSAMQQQLSGMTVVKEHGAVTKIESWLMAKYQWLQNLVGVQVAQILAGVAALILILLLWFICPCRRWRKKAKKAAQLAKEKDIDEETEYDYLASAESIPAKLNLARAYIDMDDRTAAEAVLHEVITVGNAEQKGEAEKLLQQIGH